jgi:hypothetical protein
MSIRAYAIDGSTPPKISRDVVLPATLAQIQGITVCLATVRDFLAPWGTKVTTVTDAAQRYVPLQAGGNKELFFKSIKWLKFCVDQYRDATSRWYLNVANGNVQGSMASAVPLAKRDWLDIRDPDAMPRHTTFLIQPQFTQPFVIGQQTRQLTAHGQATSLLHELTHSTLGTKDLYATNDDSVRPYAFTEEGSAPADSWTEIYQADQCEQLATSRAAYKPSLERSEMPCAWMNAENWTRALMTGLYSNGNPEPAEFLML